MFKSKSSASVPNVSLDVHTARHSYEMKNALFIHLIPIKIKIAFSQWWSLPMQFGRLHQAEQPGTLLFILATCKTEKGSHDG